MAPANAVIHIDETKFNMLMDAINHLEESGLNGAGLQSSIFRLIKRFSPHLTDEQKRNIFEQHKRYESEKEKRTRNLKNISEDDDYKHALRDHMREDEDSVGGF